MIRKIIYGLFIILGIFLIGLGIKQNIDLNKSIKSGSVTINNKKIKVEIANDFFEIKKGLGGREELKDDRGMLFVFSDKNERIFWMKDINFPLDVIWIEDDTIIGMEENCEPGGENPDKQYYSKIPVNYVLEVNGGFIKNNNIKIGDKVILDL